MSLLLLLKSAPAFSGYRTGAVFNDLQTVATDTMVVTIPASAQVGDVALVSMVQNTGVATGTAPAGWTQVIAPVTSTSNNQRVWLWKRQIIAGDPGAQFTFTSSVIARLIGIVDVYAGVDFATIAATGSQSGSTALTSHVSPTITTSATGTLVSNLWSVRSGTATAFTWTLPGTHTSNQLVRSAFTATPNYTLQSSRLTTPGVAGTYGGETATSSSAGSDVLLSIALPLTVASNLPAANAGADAAVDIWTQFNRTGTTTGAAPTSHAWTVVSGPANAAIANGTTLSTAAALSFRPVTSGDWTLRYTATNAAGSTSDDLVLTVNASSTGATGPRILAVVADRNAPAAGDQALIAHWVGTSPFQVVAVRSDEDAEWAGAYDAVWISDSADTATLAAKYKTVAKPLLMTQGFTADEYSMLIDNGDTFLLAGVTTTELTRYTPNGGLTSPVTLFGGAGSSVVFSRALKVPPNARPLLNVTSEPNSNIAWSLEEKSTYLDATTVPARRLSFGLPAGSAGNLTANGLTLLDSYVTWLTAAPTPYVYGGADTGGPVGSTLTRTAVDNSTSAITARSWSIVAGPTGVGSTLSTTTALSWTPSVTGSYVLRYSATNSNGVGTWDVVVDVVAAAQPAAFRYYRFQPTALGNGAAAVGVQIAELEFRNGFAAVSMAGATATGVGTTDSSPNELPPKAIDGSLATKWLNFGKTTGYLQVDMGAVTTVTNYRIGTANDAAERDPISWAVDGSSDGTNWVNLDTRTNYATPIERGVYTGMLTVTGIAPATVLNIGPGAGQNHFALQVARTGAASQVTVEQVDLAAGYYEDPYFLTVTTAQGLAVQSWVRVDAPPSSGSTFPRVELREVNPDGSNAGWDPNIGEHILHAWVKIPHLTPVKPEVVVMQLHDGASDALSIRTQLVSTTIRLRARVGNTSITTPQFASPYVPDTWVELKIRLIDGAVEFYGTDMVTPLITRPAGTLPATAGVTTYYWKTGDYAQTNPTFDVGTDFVSTTHRDLLVTHIAAGATVVGATATATADSAPGTVTAGATVVGATATATALSDPGTPTVDAMVVGATATATALSDPGVVSAGATVVGATATATALSDPGTPTVDVTVVGATATATALSDPGTVSAGALIDGATATATADSAAGAPTVTGGGTAVGDTALATANSDPGIVSAGALIIGATATGTAQSDPGTPDAPLIILGATATAAADSPPGTPLAGATVTGATATATADSAAGVVVAGALILGATAVATADSPAGIGKVLATARFQYWDGVQWTAFAPRVWTGSAWVQVRITVTPS